MCKYSAACKQTPFYRSCLRFTLAKLNYPFTDLDRALHLQEVEAARTSRQLPHKGGEVVSPTHLPPLPFSRYHWYSFLLKAESTQVPSCGWKDSVNKKIQAVIETATFWPVALCPNPLRHRVTHLLH